MRRLHLASKSTLLYPMAFPPYMFFRSSNTGPNHEVSQPYLTIIIKLNAYTEFPLSHSLTGLINPPYVSRIGRKAISDYHSDFGQQKQRSEVTVSAWRDEVPVTAKHLLVYKI
ncbi:hypothetical protein Droror1_Dr00022523 [Drosera rotundifolia]